MIGRIAVEQTIHVRDIEAALHKVRASDVLKYDEQGGLVSLNLDIKNPRAKEDITHRPPEQLAESILQKEQQIAAIMTNIKELLAKQPA